MELKHWQREAVYQIYPRSFCDSNGDGIGDIPGIISKLDYLKDLGVGILWLSPIYVSPQFDMGYDVADYYAINPEYGTMEDFDRLLEEAKKRGIRIVMDLVVNHTSSEHAWFLASKDPSSPYRDYYVWMDGKEPDGKKPPNNWTSNFTGPAWTYDPVSKQWYLHLFAPEQPDLNWHNPKVLEEVEKILRFYLDKGVYGFRCDVINQIYKDSYEDGKGFAFNGRGNEHYLMTEGNHRILRTLYDDVFSKYDCVVIGETYAVDKANGKRFLENNELTMFFEFEHNAVDRAFLPVLKKKFSAEKMKDVLFAWQKELDWNAVYLENHDNCRSVDRYGDVEHHHKESAKALALFYLFLRGTPFVYEGQEIGMKNFPIRAPELSKDVCVEWVNKIAKKLPITKKMRYKLCDAIDRDQARAPMQWDASVSAGFSTSEATWLPVNSDYREINVMVEGNDPDSILSFYKKALHIRRENECLYLGTFEEIHTKGDLIAYKRVYEGQTGIVVLNLGRGEIPFPMGLVPMNHEAVLSTYSDEGDSSVLRPYEGRLYLPIRPKAIEG